MQTKVTALFKHFKLKWTKWCMRMKLRWNGVKQQINIVCTFYLHTHTAYLLFWTYIDIHTYLRILVCLLLLGYTFIWLLSCFAQCHILLSTTNICNFNLYVDIHAYMYVHTYAHMLLNVLKYPCASASRELCNQFTIHVLTYSFLHIWFSLLSCLCCYSYCCYLSADFLPFNVGTFIARAHAKLQWPTDKRFIHKCFSIHQYIVHSTYS